MFHAGLAWGRGVVVLWARTSHSHTGKLLYVSFILDVHHHHSPLAHTGDAHHLLVHSLPSSCHPLLTTKRAVTPANTGIYGVSFPITVAPNVMLVSYIDDESSSNLLNVSEELTSLKNVFFPPSSTPAPPPTHKCCLPRKCWSMGYIPHLPNMFMLLCAEWGRNMSLGQ